MLCTLVLSACGDDSGTAHAPCVSFCERAKAAQCTDDVEWQACESMCLAASASAEHYGCAEANASTWTCANALSEPCSAAAFGNCFSAAFTCAQQHCSAAVDGGPECPDEGACAFLPCKSDTSGPTQEDAGTGS